MIGPSKRIGSLVSKEPVVLSRWGVENKVSFYQQKRDSCADLSSVRSPFVRANLFDSLGLLSKRQYTKSISLRWSNFLINSVNKKHIFVIQKNGCFPLQVGTDCFKKSDQNSFHCSLSFQYACRYTSSNLRHLNNLFT